LSGLDKRVGVWRCFFGEIDDLATGSNMVAPVVCEPTYAFLLSGQNEAILYLYRGSWMGIFTRWYCAKEVTNER
jgi:hypothetical protein